MKPSSKTIFAKMAAAPSWRNKLEEELECSLCLERLTDPRVFPQCQHSFCYGCIVDLSRGKSKISCPECRAEVEVSSMFNVYVNKLLANIGEKRTFLFKNGNKCFMLFFYLQLGWLSTRPIALQTQHTYQ